MGVLFRFLFLPEAGFIIISKSSNTLNQVPTIQKLSNKYNDIYANDPTNNFILNAPFEYADWPFKI